MKKALIVYNQNSGRGNFEKKFNFIKKELASSFNEMLFLCPKSKEEAKDIYLNVAQKYDSLIVIGGDGTLNLAINEIMKLETRPTIGYINSGTLGDAGKNFGITRSLKRSLKIIKNGKTKKADIGEISNSKEHMYFLYTCCIGTYSSLSYTVKNKNKRHMYQFSYYFASIKEMFRKNDSTYTYKIEGIEKEVTSPFVLLMNGKYMASFKLNKHSDISDGLMECYFPKPSFLNGILRFLPFKREKDIKTDEIEIRMDNRDAYWCLDGEKGPQGNVKITLKRAQISFYSM